MDHHSPVLARVGAWRDGTNLFDRDAFPSGEGGFAAAGILTHLPALLALGGPVPVSYLRLVPSHWAGVFACWGVETRETGLRYVPGTAGLAGAANLEVECFDLAANPYLLLGGLIAAALDGLAAKRPLPEPVEGDPGAPAGCPAAAHHAGRRGDGVRRHRDAAGGDGRPAVRRGRCGTSCRAGPLPRRRP